MSDQFNVTATPSWPSTPVAAGTALKVSITGNDVQTTVQSSNVTVTLNLLAADGATGTVQVPLTLAKTITTPESVVIASVTDTDSPTRTWTVAADGLSASAVA